MRFKPTLLVLAAVSAGAIAPTAASARPIDAVAHPAAGQTCGKDYSRNSVTGDYCSPVGGSASPASRPAAVPVSAPAQITVKHDSGFSWGDAGAGAGGAIALLAVTAGGAIALRRRSPTPS